MLNRHFDSSNNPDFIYANAVLQNIDYALISLNYIFNKSEFYSQDIYHNDHTYYFYYIQNTLTACGNISNVFYNNSKWDNVDITQRCNRIRKKYGIRKSQFKLIFFKEVRNTNEHFDERYLEFNNNIGDLNLIYDNTDAYMRNKILTEHHLRTYDVSNHIYYTYNRKQNLIMYDLLELHDELVEMKNIIQNNPLTYTSWDDLEP